MYCKCIHIHLREVYIYIAKVYIYKLYGHMTVYVLQIHTYTFAWGGWFICDISRWFIRNILRLNTFIAKLRYNTYIHSYICVTCWIHMRHGVFDSEIECASAKVQYNTANPTWGDIFESSKLKRLFCHVPVNRNVRALSFELWNSIRKCHHKWDRLYIYSHMHICMCIYKHKCLQTYIFINISIHTHTWMQLFQIVLRSNASRHVWMSHVTQRTESCHTKERVMPHKRMRHVTQRKKKNESRHANARVTSHLKFSYLVLCQIQGGEDS